MTSTVDPVDLLLLNTSNYPRVPLFPYAFVQVTEVARRHGLRIKSHDFLGTPGGDLEVELRWLVERYRPRMIGLHLRQTDTLFIDDYREDHPGGVFRPRESGRFEPVLATARLVSLLRRITSAPLVIGGHGFSSSPSAVFDKVRPDFGVRGEPDGFFAAFEDLLARRGLASVPNLMYRDGDRPVMNERVFFPPAPGPEYTDEQVEDFKRFYGTTLLHTQAAPVELMRGCPYHCYFCVEPLVKGQEARVRDLDALMADVERLSAGGIRRFWLVCSELNVFGPDLALAMAERMLALRERTGVPVRWYAFSLPVRMSEATWRTLARAGFRGGFTTVQSLDDENLRRGRIPHRAADALREYRIVNQVARETGDGDEFRVQGTLGVFLGNSFATTETIHRSLRALSEAGLLENIRVPAVLHATRVFETMLDDGRQEGNPRSSYADGKESPLDFSQPTFEYAKALLDHFGDRRTLETFFAWIDSTVLCRAHERDKDWPLFLANTTTPARLAAWCEERRLQAGDGPPPPSALHGLSAAARSALSELLAQPTVERLRRLFFPPPHERPVLAQAAHGLLVSLFEHHAPRVEAALRHLGVEGTMAEALAAPIYGLLEGLYRRHIDVDSLHAAVLRELGASDDSMESLFVRYFIYRRNIVLNPKYKEALFGTATPQPRRVPLAMVSTS